MEPVEEALLSARTIAVVGLDDREWRTAYRIAEYLQAAGYRVIPVPFQQWADEVLGEKSYRQVQDIPFHIDLVDVFVRSEQTGSVIEDAIAAGAGAVWLQAGIRNDAGLERAREAGLLATQDRCTMVEHRRLLRERGAERPWPYEPRHTEVLRVDPRQPEPAVIERAARLLREGGLVAFPTETVYGLGANALDEQAVRSIYSAKERDPADPVIVHIADEAGLEQVASRVPPLARELARRFWPGALTLVLERGGAVAPAVSAGLGTVAVRMPSHPVARAMIAAAGVPVAAPSANLFMRTSATTAEHVLEDLEGRIDLVVDGGPADAGIESTVVDARAVPVRLLRPGAVTVEQLREVLGDDLALPAGGEAVAVSPGLLAKHYAPRGRLVLIEGRGGLRRMCIAARRALRNGQRVGLLLARGESVPLPGDIAEGAATCIVLGAPGDHEAMARNLFAALREMDRRGVDVIFARDPGEEGLARALRDRLRRAASERIGGPRSPA